MTQPCSVFPILSAVRSLFAAAIYISSVLCSHAASPPCQGCSEVRNCSADGQTHQFYSPQYANSCGNGGNFILGYGQSFDIKWQMYLCCGYWPTEVTIYRTTGAAYEVAHMYDDTVGTTCLEYGQSDNPKIKDEQDLGPCPDGTGDDCGMPVWWVSEPFISLWLKDEPLGYQPALGPRISFELQFGQRDASAGSETNVFSAGKKWNFPWLSYVSLDANGSSVVNFPGGGATTYHGAVDYLTNTRLTGDTNSGFTVAYPDGSSDLYGFVVTNGVGAFQKAFLTQHRNPFGQAIRLSYFPYMAANTVIRLKEIVDANGGTNSISYVSANTFSTNLISQVTDPFGRSASLAYDDSGRLTNITDVIGLSSSIGYDTNGWPTNLVTPYGTTSFKITDVVGDVVIPNYRSIVISEPDGSHQLYLYTNSPPGISNSYPSGDIPDTSPYANTFDSSALGGRSTFHWGKKQYALSTTNILALNANDFIKARMRQWLLSDPTNLGTTLSLERAPSQDGTTPGQKTWYDYAGKPSTGFEGTQTLPLFVARVIPNGTTAFTRTARNSNGLTTNEVSTYTAPGGSIALRTNTFKYAANDIDLIAVTNALGVRVLSNSFNGFHQILTSFNALNEQTIYTYNSTQQLTSASFPSGLITTNVYGSDGYLSQQAAPGLATNSFTWANGLIQMHTDPRGLTVSSAWDNLRRLRRVDFPDGTFLTNVYDKLDLVKTTDRMGYVSSFGYNSVRQRIAATNANGVVSRYGYCICGALESVTNAFAANEQQVTTYSWDLQGNLLQTVAPDGYAVTRKYNSLGQVTNISDALSSLTNWFNNQGLQTASSNSAGRLDSLVYDVLDRPITNVDANSVTVASAFDSLNRLTSRTHPDGAVEKFGYSSRGLVAYTNQLNFPSFFGYDALGRKTAETNANNEAIQYTHSPAGDLLTLTDGKNQTTTWNYDEYGRPTNKVDALGAVIFKFSFDQNNRCTNRWTPAKGDTRYGYDPVGNLSTINYQHSTNINLAYDLLNRLTNMVDAVGTTKYSYNGAAQLLSEDGPWSDDTVSYTYAYRLRSTLTLLQPSASAWTNGYGYDAARRLTNVTSKAGSFGYQYDSQHSTLVSQLSLPGGAYITNSYDSSARLLSTTLKNSGGTTLNSHSYELNQGSQRTRQTFTAGNCTDYTYDPSGQLKTALGKEAGGATIRFHEQMGYSYDPAGNLSWRTNNDLLQQFAVNPLNELTNVSRNAAVTVSGVTTMPATNVTVSDGAAAIYADRTFARTNIGLADGANTFTAIAADAHGHRDTNSFISFHPSSISLAFDANGNLRTNGTRTFDYDDENQLIRITEPAAWKSEFAYDGKMRRRICKEFMWTGSWTQTNEVRYIYDSNLVVQERDTTNIVQVTYTRGYDFSGTLQGAGGVGGILARSEPSAPATQIAYYHTDGNGNVTCLVNTNQLIVGRYLYDPYGNTLAISGPIAERNSYRYSSKEIHPNSAVYYFGYRFYVPDLQRWANRDPIGEAGGIGLARYVACNPISRFDPFGLDGNDSDRTYTPGELTDAISIALSGFELRLLQQNAVLNGDRTEYMRLVGQIEYIGSAGARKGKCPVIDDWENTRDSLRLKDVQRQRRWSSLRNPDTNAYTMAELFYEAERQYSLLIWLRQQVPQRPRSSYYRCLTR